MNILNTNQGLCLCWYIRWDSLLLVIYVNIKFKNRGLKCEGILGSRLYLYFDVLFMPQEELMRTCTCIGSVA